MERERERGRDNEVDVWTDGLMMERERNVCRVVKNERKGILWMMQTEEGKPAEERFSSGSRINHRPHASLIPQCLAVLK